MTWRSIGVDRQGHSSSGIEYSFHGSGCLLTAENGDLVDVDLIADPKDGEVEAFDAWRVLSMSEEHEALAIIELKAACVYLAASGSLREVQPGRWYVLPRLTSAWIWTYLPVMPGQVSPCAVCSPDRS